MDCQPTQAAVRDYGARWAIEIVFTQMTKTDVFAGGAGGDHVADFDRVVGDDDSINQQFDQAPFLLEGCLSQAALHTVAKRGDRGDESGQFGGAIDVGVKLLRLCGPRLDFLVQFRSPPLVFRQCDYPRQISLSQPFDLALKLRLSPA